MKPTKRNSITTSTTAIKITVNEHAAVVAAGDADIIAPLLEIPVNSFTAAGRNGVHHSVYWQQHYGRWEGGMVFCSGLMPRVQQALEQQGYKVVIEDHTRCKWLDEAREAAQRLPELCSEDERLLDTVLDKPHGQVLVQGAADIAHIIAQMADVFASRPLLIVAKNSASAARLHELVSAFTDRRIALYPQEPWRLRIAPWAIIGTSQLFGICELDPWEVVLFADVESVLAARSMEQLHARRDFICYSFRSPHRRLNDREEFQLEGTVGPIVYRYPRPDRQAAEVDVILLRAPRAAIPLSSTALDRKRAQIWHHEHRNCLIANLAKGIQRGSSKKLIAQGLLNHRQAQTIFADRHYPGVAVLVESAEHGNELHRLLPRWHLRKGYEALSCIPVIDSGEIATMINIEEFGAGVDVLIRADGGIDWPLSPEVFPRKRRLPDRVAVIDLQQRGGRRARRTAQRLRKAYRDRGWHLTE